MAKTKCDICGEPAGFMNYKYSDGIVCSRCIQKARTHGLWQVEHVSEIRCVLENTEQYADMTEEEKKQLIMKVRAEAKEKRMAEIQAKIKEINKPISLVDNTPRCPKCGSTSISADKKGYGIGKGVVGAAVAGPIGLTLGNAGAKKVRITCLACGHQWMAGKK